MWLDLRSLWTRRSTSTLAGLSAPTSVAFSDASAALQADGCCVASSVLVGLATVAYAASGLINPSSVFLGNEGETDVEQGVVVASSVLYGQATVSFAASGLSAPASILVGSATSANVLAGLSNPSSVLAGDLQLLSDGSISGLAVASSIAFGSIASALQLDGRLMGASVLLGDLQPPPIPPDIVVGGGGGGGSLGGKWEERSTVLRTVRKKRKLEEPIPDEIVTYTYPPTIEPIHVGPVDISKLAESLVTAPSANWADSLISDQRLRQSIGEDARKLADLEREEHEAIAALLIMLDEDET